MPVTPARQSRRFRIWSEMSSSSSRLHLPSPLTRGHRARTGGRGRLSHAQSITTTRFVRGAMIVATHMSSLVRENWQEEGRGRVQCQLHLARQEASRGHRVQGEGRKGSRPRCTIPNTPTMRYGPGQWRPAHRGASATGPRETPMGRGAGQLLSSLSPRSHSPAQHRLGSNSSHSSFRLNSHNSYCSLSHNRDRDPTAKLPPL